MIDDVKVQSIAVARARASLSKARRKLDEAMTSLSWSDGETVMVSAELLTLLSRAVAARRQLEDAEGRPKLASIAPLP